MEELQLDPSVIINAAADSAATDYKSALTDRALLKAQVVALNARVQELEKQLADASEQPGQSA